MTYILAMVAMRELQFCIDGRPMSPTYLTGQRRVTYNLFWWKTYVTYILIMVATRELQLGIGGRSM